MKCFSLFNQLPRSIPLLTDHTLLTLDKGIYALYPHRKQTLLVSEFMLAIGEPAIWESYIPEYHLMNKQA